VTRNKFPATEKDSARGLKIIYDGHGWDVVHTASGLKVAMDLRLRRFAQEARREFLATGVDFTKGRDEVQRARGDWAKIYHVWWDRARRHGLDQETFEWYASYVPYGAKVPTTEQARLMRQSPANVEKFLRGVL
jgi:hypothetical protein